MLRSRLYPSGIGFGSRSDSSPHFHVQSSLIVVVTNGAEDSLLQRYFSMLHNNLLGPDPSC